MTLTPVPFPGFGAGLDLRDQPDIVNPSAAIDAMNVTFTERGAVKQRDGYGKFTSVVGTNRYDSMVAFYKTDATKQLVAGAGSRLEAISTAGAVLASSAAPTASPHFFARFGGPTGEFLFCANGADQLRKYDGSSFSAPSYTGTAPTGKFVAVTPWDNRMVNARRTGAVAGDNRSTVRFSAAGDPLTWGANDYVDLEPGDGEDITGIAVYQDKVFVFKETKFFYFYNTVSSGTGTPTFYFHAVELGAGCSSPKAICVGREGVYFLNQRGIYRTTGAPPQLVSQALDPLFYGVTSDFYTGGVFNQAQLTLPAMTWHREQIYCALPVAAGTANGRTLVFDPRDNWWTIYDIPAAAMTPFKVADQPDLMFAYASGTNDIGRHNSSFTTDAGTSIVSRWRSGWFDYSTTTMKTLREMKLWGKGVVSIGVGVDFKSASNSQVLNLAGSIDRWGDGTGSDTWGDGTSSTDVWATGQSLVPKLYRSAVRGTVFSIELASSGANAWALYRMSTHLRGQRAPTVVTA